MYIVPKIKKYNFLNHLTVKTVTTSQLQYDVIDVHAKRVLTLAYCDSIQTVTCDFMEARDVGE